MPAEIVKELRFADDFWVNFLVSGQIDNLPSSEAIVVGPSNSSFQQRFVIKLPIANGNYSWSA